MRFVAVKSAAQQDVQAVHRVRQQLAKRRSALVNQICGLLAEYGWRTPDSGVFCKDRQSSISAGYNNTACLSTLLPARSCTVRNDITQSIAAAAPVAFSTEATVQEEPDASGDVRALHM